MSHDDTPLSKAQEDMLSFHDDVGSCAWFAPPGFGKTRAYLQNAYDTGDRTLVLAPKLVCMDTWPRENKKWGYKLPMRFLHGPQKHLRGPELVSVINPEAAPWIFGKMLESRKPIFKTVVLDELSMWKNPTAKRVLSWVGELEKGKVGARVKTDYVIGGTGTPVGAHLKDLFGEMLCVDGGRSLGTDHEKFLRQHFHHDKYTQRLEPYHDSEQKILDAISHRAISFDINDLGLDKPMHIPHYLELPPAARQAYEEMHEHNVVEELELYAANAAVKSSKLRQLTGGGVIDLHGGRKYLHDAKADHLASILAENDGRPTLVFFEFQSDYETICRVLKRDVPVLYGRTSQRDAKRWLKDWNAGRLPVFALHPRSAAYGLNLQDAGNHIVFYTLPWSFEMVNQGIARLWRQGQKKTVVVHYLMVENTKDEDVYERVAEREETHYRVMEALL